MAPVIPASPRSPQRLALAAGVIGLIALAASAIQRTGAGGDLPSPEPNVTDSETLVWHPEDRRAYRLQIDSLVTLRPDGAAGAIAHRLRALLCLRVAEVGAGFAEVAFQLREVDYRVADRVDTARAEALGLPFVVRFDGGMPTAFRYPPGLDPEIRDQLAEVVRTFQATAPAPRTGSWNVLEEHLGGRYRAAYLARDGVWHKRKAAYLRGPEVAGAGGSAAGRAQVRVLASDGWLRPSATASWWDGAELADELELSNDGQFVARVATRAVLSAADAAFDPAADIARVRRSEHLLDRPVPTLPAAEAQPVVEPKIPSPADRARLRAFLAGFAASRGDDLRLVHELAAMLREFPELAAEFPPLLRDPDLLATVAAGLAHALELAGNLECQEALAAVGADPSYPEGNRLRAIVALSGVARPSRQSRELLTWLSEAGREGGVAAEDLGATAVLALGRMGRTLRESASADYALVRATIQEAVERGLDANSQAAALDALANTGDPDLAPVAVRALQAADAAVRAAAAKALGSLDSAGGGEALAGRLGVEDDPRVRTALVAGIRAMARPGEAVLQACARLCEDEPDPAARGQMARLLVDHLDRIPEARPMLERLLRRERDPATMAYVGGRLR
jgi:hypothetical protein